MTLMRGIQLLLLLGSALLATSCGDMSAADQRKENDRPRVLEITPSGYAYLGDAVTPPGPRLILIRFSTSGCNATDPMTGTPVSTGPSPEHLSVHREGRRIWGEVRTRAFLRDCESQVGADLFAVLPATSQTQVDLAARGCDGGVSECALPKLSPEIAANWVCSVGTLTPEDRPRVHPGSTPSCERFREERVAVGQNATP